MKLRVRRWGGPNILKPKSKQGSNHSYEQHFQRGDERGYAPFEVTISFRLIIFGWCNAFRILTSRRAVIGNPFSSCLVLIRFKATISLDFLSRATNTLPYVPSPTFRFFSNTSTSRNTTGAWIHTCTVDSPRVLFEGGGGGGKGASLRFGAAGGGGRAPFGGGGGGGAWRLGGGGGGTLLFLAGGGGGGLTFGGMGLLPEGGPGGGGGRVIVCAIAIVFGWSPTGTAA